MEEFKFPSGYLAITNRLCSRCQSCRYMATFGHGLQVCDYIGATGHCRPSKPGPACTAYERSKKNAGNH